MLRKQLALSTGSAGKAGGAAEGEAAGGQVSLVRNTKGYSSTYLAMGFADVRAGTR